ncbi:DUF2339 domain-containing protein [Agrilutibacter solisilvae]|uniref:DUF2339 domain-containing protein n=1 Tax=Agrilutibacter solisilvae TaxID=2763317 RepID=A0A975AT08_9GAMM|nr:DUF2339 domain-containing protein [Lysobacter solisilvae]QSX78624.1 DUF2339 domain-containing protein [Lysobacter solisilvae]
MEGLFVLLVLAVLAVPVLVVVALVKISGLRHRLELLEEEVAQLHGAREPQAVPSEPTLADLMREQAPPAAAAPPRAQPAEYQASQPPAAAAPPGPVPTPPRPEPAMATPPPLPPRPAAALPRIPSPRPPRSSPDPVVVIARAVRHWFTEGNVPVKVGMLVLFAGVAALLKYASDQGWFTLPIELRLAGVSLAAVAGLVFGWRQRQSRRSFALSLQGGAVGVLLLVVFAAFKLYHLLPAPAAFGLSVAIVAGAGVLAVLQNALALALLASLAGFLAPLWLSTGSGNHVALFGYYAILDAAILGIAWFRPWRALNLLGFAFTFGIGALWGAWSYAPDKFDTTQPFLALFFGFYLLLPLLYARRRAAGRRDLVDGCLVFGTPLVAFALEAGLMHGTFGADGARMPLAFCALGLGALYAGLAALLRGRDHYAPLLTAYAVLAVGFATLAVPLALSAQATASVFALEGAALAWLGLRQRRRLPQLSGLLMQVLAAGSFALGVEHSHDPLQAVANARFMGALLISLAGLASAWSYWRRDDGTRAPALPYYLWGLAWWLGNGITEIVRFVDEPMQVDATLIFLTATAWLAAEASRRLRAPALAWTAALGFVAAPVLALVQWTAHDHPFRELGGLAWLAFAALGWRSLRCLREDEGHAPAVAHAAWLWTWPLVLAIYALDLTQAARLGDGWRIAAFGLPWLAVAALLQWRPTLAGAPMGARFAQWRAPLQGSILLALLLGAAAAMFAPGQSEPLPWLPLLNPLDLAQVAVLALLLRWLASPGAPEDLARLRIPLIAAAAFALVTVITLRATHHWGGVAWNGGMAGQSLVQTSLTIVWSVLGVLGWIIGSRRRQRGLWLAGALLMGVVLAKLVLVDRTHLGNLLGIASFIAYGLLCTAVGYFAPAPPRADADTGTDDGRTPPAPPAHPLQETA